MKTRILAGLLLLVAVVSAGRNPSVYIAGSPKDETNVELPETSLDAYLTLLENNLGLLKNAPKDAESAQIIKKYRSNGNLFNSLTLNYLVLYESNADGAQLQRSSPQFKLIHPGTNDVSIVRTLLDRLYNSTSEVAATKTGGKTAHRPWYLFTDDSKEFEEHKEFGLFPLVTESSAVRLYETHEDTIHKVSDNMMGCINKEFSRVYHYEESKKGIYKIGTDTNIQFTDEQKPHFELFLADICALVKLPNMLTAERSMTFLTVHLKSLLNLEAVVTKEQDLTVVYNLFEAALRKFHSKIEQKFGAHQVAGHAVSLPNEDVPAADSLKKEVESHQTTQFVADHHRRSAHRILAGTDTTTDINTDTTETTVKTTETPVAWQIRIWFSLVFFLALLWILIQLFTEEQSKDTLLYAKFVTGPESR